MVSFLVQAGAATPETPPTLFVEAGRVQRRHGHGWHAYASPAPLDSPDTDRVAAMTVHFPIAFCVAAPVCLVLSLCTPWAGFDAALLVLLAAAAVFTPIALVTGLFTWWLNYAAARIRPIVVKLLATPLLLVAVVWALVWRLRVPDVLAHPGSNPGFVILVLALLPLVSVIGWCGAALTFPPHDDE